MQKAARKKWLDALRSDKYKQGRNRLLTEETAYDAEGNGSEDVVRSFCCLAVACDIAPVGHWEDGFYVVEAHESISGEQEIDKNEMPPTIAQIYGLANQSGGFLATESMQWDGIGTCNIPPTFENQYKGDTDLAQGLARYTCLANLNDGHKWDFEKISNVLEAEPDGLIRVE